MSICSFNLKMIQIESISMENYSNRVHFKLIFVSEEMLYKTNFNAKKMLKNVGEMRKKKTGTHSS